jgi:hypothetical protein
MWTKAHSISWVRSRPGTVVLRMTSAPTMRDHYPHLRRRHARNNNVVPACPPTSPARAWNLQPGREMEPECSEAIRTVFLLPPLYEQLDHILDP